MNKTIEVYGSVKLERKISKYRAKISLEVNQNCYEEEVTDLEEIKNQYYLALVENGIDVSKFEEDTFEFRAGNYQMEGTLLKYECTSKKEIKDVLDVKVPGVYVNLFDCNYVINDDIYNKLLDLALVDARFRANQIALKIGKNLGEIVSISDKRTQNSYWSHFSTYDEYFDLKVVFEIA